MNTSNVSWTKRFARLSSLTVILLLVLNLSAYAGPGGQSGDKGQGAERSQANGKSTETTSASSAPDHSDTANCDGDTGNKSDTGNGANSGTEYDNTCPNEESKNGNGDGGAGRPCAGCVGQADDKNPKGQMPNADDDGNNGYECDGNSGIARTNPAHTGCASTTSLKTYGANATIGDLVCGTTSVLVTMNNTNNAAAGSRSFTVKLDGNTVSTHTVASGGSLDTTVAIPATGTHTVSVVSTGMTTVTKSALSQSDCATLGANATIGDLVCGDTSVAVTLNNTNNAVAGSRSFTVKLDGNTVSTHTVASGGSLNTTVAIPSTGAHAVSVESAGMTTVTKSGISQATCVEPTFGANANIGSLTCTTQAVAVRFNNTNNAAGGARSFTVKLDGATVSTHEVASGASGSTSVSIPATGTHTVSVESAGMTAVTKSGLARLTCVLGEKFTNANGPKPTKVLGVRLSRTGGNQLLMAVFALALLGLGLAFELGGRKKLVFNR